MPSIQKVSPPYNISMIRIREKLSISSLLKKYNLNREQIINKKDNYVAGDILLFYAEKRQFHIVKPNESIENIARKYGVSPSDILQKNHSKTIFNGQILLI